MKFLEILNEDDIIELQSSINESIYSELETNPLQYSDKDFYEILTKYILDLFYTEWEEAELCNKEDYYELGEFVYDFILDFFETYKEFPHRQYSEYKDEDVCKESLIEKIKYLKDLPQPKQKSIEWYEYRYNLLTASSIWKVFGSESMMNSIIYEKCKPLDPNISKKYMGSSIQWGNIFEPVSIMIYERKYKTKVEDFGCIQHPEIKCIGASPDGINVDENSEKFGRMLEVKNIYNRDIDGNPKEEYWIQMQIQLETCDLEICDFLETRFKEYELEEEYFEDVSSEWKGIILTYYNVSQNEIIYKYSELNIESIDYINWKNELSEEFEKKGFTHTKTYFYYLDELSCVVVKRNRLWFNSAKNKIIETWDIILKERVEGYEHRSTKKKIENNKVFVSHEDNDSHLIHNLTIDNKIEIVKMDS